MPPIAAKSHLPAWPLAMLAGLLALCAAYGQRVTAGLAMPPDLDALRDIGFAQGLLDGNWLGDPTYADGLRYYPPLVPALGALLARISGTRDLPGLWVALGPWAGLLPVAACFLLARRLFASAGAAACATAAFVLLNGATIDPWLAGGYTPWLLTPLLAQAGFLASAWFIHRAAAAARWRDAPLAGLAIGLTFLGHVIPALLLTAMLVAAMLAAHGPRPRLLAWLALAGAVQGLAMAPYLLPLLATYPQGVVHLAPGNWTAPPLAPDWGAFAAVLALNAPVLAGGLAAALHWRRLDRVAAAMLAVWIGLCLLALGRHYACAALDPQDAVCRVLRLPVHHFHLYLQIAGALLAGRLCWAALAPAAPRWRLAAAVAAALLLGLSAALLRPYDLYARGLAEGDGGSVSMDLPAYRWVLDSTPPDALFVLLGDERKLADEPGAFAVMAAGRKLMASDTLFSNPYLDWTRRERRRAAAVRWLQGDATPIACADFAHGLWAMLPPDTPVAAGRARPVFRTPGHVIYAVSPLGCAAGEAALPPWWRRG